MTFFIQPRRALYVYLKNLKYAHQFKKYGHVTYISQQMNLVAVYVNEDQVQHLVDKFNQMKFVKTVKVSPRPDIDPDLGDQHDDVFFENYDQDQEES
ncbi:YlbG family protein [Leuconostocaceae bacterium ESL0723]|nr:YlbG family protein [Leuconostocaceae bacterium ESL0723]